MIFADSSYFIAIADQKDQWHSRARELSEKAHNELLVTDLILSECVTALGARGGGKAGVALYEYIFDNCEVVFVAKDMFEKSMDIFLKYDGTLSLADVVSLAVMEDYEVKSILSFDSDFDKVKGIIRLA